MIMVIVGVLVVSFWTAVTWFAIPTRTVWKQALGKIDKNAHKAMKASFKFLLGEHEASDIPEKISLDMDVELMDQNAKEWVKEEYVSSMYNFLSFLMPRLSQFPLAVPPSHFPSGLAFLRWCNYPNSFCMIPPSGGSKS
jgi:hypothetical protein